ncbi:MAG TPA: hypothetical protein VF088_14085 [Pyrinomonadaceae bacterium]
MSGLIFDWRTAIVNGDLLSVTGYQQRMIREVKDHPFSDRSDRGILNLRTCLLVDDLKYALQRFSMCLSE